MSYFAGASTPFEPSLGVLRVEADNAEPILTACGSPSEDTRPVIDQPKDSPEIPETLVVTLNNVRRSGDDRGDDGSAPS